MSIPETSLKIHVPFTYMIFLLLLFFFSFDMLLTSKENIIHKKNKQNVKCLVMLSQEVLSLQN